MPVIVWLYSRRMMVFAFDPSGSATVTRLADHFPGPTGMGVFGGWGMSGNGGRFGPEANLEAFTQFQWVTVRDEPPSYPY